CRRGRNSFRYDKPAANYLAFVQLASIRLWVRVIEYTARRGLRTKTSRLSALFFRRLRGQWRSEAESAQTLQSLLPHPISDSAMPAALASDARTHDHLLRSASLRMGGRQA